MTSIPESPEIQRVTAQIEALKFMVLFLAVISLINFAATMWYYQLGAQEKPDMISVALTIFEVFLVISLGGGFWMLRGAAQDAARREAHEEAAKIAMKEASEAAARAAETAFREWAAEWRQASEMGSGTVHHTNALVRALGNDDGARH